MACLLQVRLSRVFLCVSLDQYTPQIIAVIIN
jgi:hypothetical protein